MNPGDDKFDEALHLFGRFTTLAYNTSTVAELRQALIDFFSVCGIKMMSYHHLPPPGAVDYTPQVAVAAHGFPRDWVERYEAEFYLIDPIPKRALCSTHSFFWSDAQHFADLSDDERYYLGELAASSLGDGLAIPVFGPRGRDGYVGLGFGADGARPEAPIAILLQAACQFGHQQYCHILFAETPLEANLSPRESEILTWVARGKSNAVIGEILAISGHTVDTHLRRAFHKLGVQDRVTAALRGAALGLL